MSLTVWILIILTLIYIPIWIYAWRSPKAKKLGLEKYGPTVKINTRFGIRLMDRLKKYRRFWRGYGIYSQIVSVFLMIMMVYVMVVAVLGLPRALTSKGVGIEYALAIPGLNPIMPFWYTLLALIVALALHELAHGLQAKSNGMEVKNTGLLYAVVPVGAFVEPDEDDVKKASRRARLDLYAAGIATNFTIALVAFVVMFAGVSGVESPYGDNAAVYQHVAGSPAYEAGIPVGAVLLEIDGVAFDQTIGFGPAEQTLGWTPGAVTVTYADEDGTHVSEKMLWGVHVERVMSGSPSEGVIKQGWTLTSVETVRNGESLGVFQMYTATGFSDYMRTHTVPGDVLNVTYMSDKDSAAKTVSVTLNENPNIHGVGYLGVSTTTAGMSLTTPNTMKNIGLNPIYGCDSITEYGAGFLRYVSLPFQGFDPVPENTHWWYGEQVAGFWEFNTILYWMFWLNILLGIMNAMPAVPLDGGPLFFGWLDSIMERTGRWKDAKKREDIAWNATRNLSIFMLFLFMMVIMAAVL